MYIGVDIGGTKCAVVLADAEGNILQKARFATTTRDKTIEEILKNVKRFGAATAVGISCGGPLDSKNGIILSPPNLPGWDYVEIVSIIERETGIKAFLQNDANACALAEWKYGAGIGCKNMVFLTFGTGLGAGLILNGSLYSGTSAMAGEVGHIRLSECGPVGYGKAGSFEGFCSGNGLAQLGRLKAMELLQMGKTASFCTSLSELDAITAKDIASYANEGFEDAIEVYQTCARYLGKGLAVIIDILNPERIVLGSVYARAESLLKSEMLKVLEKECLPQALHACTILPAKLSEHVGDIAAVSVAIEGERGNLPC